MEKMCGGSFRRSSIIDCLMGHVGKSATCEVLWEMEGRYLLIDEKDRVRGLQVRKKDGLTYELHAPNV
jgi:hypothetical protein